MTTRTAFARPRALYPTRFGALHLSSILLLAPGLWAADGATRNIRGRVVDARTAQPIEKARVRTSSQATATDHDGRFSIPLSVSEGSEIMVSAVGYGVARKTVAAGENELEFRLGQDAVRHSESLDVKPSIFDVSREAPLAQSLQGVELRNLSSVIADDALRSVQAMPGVSGTDDFYASFSVRGWGFEKAGVYVDGVLVSSPFHTIRDVNDGYSLSIINNDVIGGVTLMSGGAPARFGDRVGAALEIETRDGSRDRTTARANLGAAGASFFAEGPIGHSGTSWLLGARKSFLDYVVQAIQDHPSFVVGYYDVQAKLSHQEGAHTFGLFFLHGDSDYRDDDPLLSANDVARAAAATQLLSARWRYSPSAKTSLTVGGFLTRETGANRNLGGEPIVDLTAWQSGGRVDLSRELGSSHALQVGVMARRLTENATASSYPQSGAAPDRLSFDKRRFQPSGYVQDSWRIASGRIALTGGLRVDQGSAPLHTVVLPRASARFALSSRSTLSMAAGSYAQFPAFDQLFGGAGNPDLRPETSDHYVVGFERALSDSTRARIEFYHQEERDRLGRTTREVRVQDGRVIVPEGGKFLNSGSGRSKGVEVTLQRRSPNGFTGWVSYALAQTRIHDSATGSTYYSDHDQRHTLNAYVSRRLSDRTNVSLKYRFGSNTPISGYFESSPTGFRVSEERNLLRIPAYSRLDLRANRTFSVGRARLTASVEVTNATNHDNYRYSGADIFLPSGRVVFDRQTSFPLLPAAGLTVEW